MKLKELGKAWRKYEEDFYVALANKHGLTSVDVALKIGLLPNAEDFLSKL